jgi:hypothetical protein
MGVEVNKDNFLGTILPSVKITKITLDNIHHPDGQVSKAAGENIPTALGLKIRVEIYEQIDNNGNLSYLSSSGFEKYISFRAIAVCGPHSVVSEANYEDIKRLMEAKVTSTSMLKNNISTMKDAQYPSFSVNLYEIFERIVKNNPGLGESIENITLVDEKDYMPDAIKNNIMSSQAIMQLVKSLPSFQGPGGTTYALSFDIPIELPPTDYDNKAILVFAEFDFNAFWEDWPEFVQNVDFNGIQTFYGIPSLQVVKIDGQHQHSTPAFFDEFGSRWYGPVTTINDGGDLKLYADKPTTPLQLLTVKNVPINNVVDNTVFDKIDKLTLDLDFLNNEFINSTNFYGGVNSAAIEGVHDPLLAKDIIDSLSLNSKPSIFSDLYMTRSTNTVGAAAVGLFTIDLKQLFANYSPLSMVFTNENIIDPAQYIRKIIELSRFKKFKVYRERVFDKGENKNSEKELIIDVNFQALKEANLFVDPWSYKMKHDLALDKNKLPKNYSMYSGAESNTPQVRRVFLNSATNTEFLLHFNIYDPTVPSNANGLSSNGIKYAYSVEIAIEDGTSDFMLSRYIKLSQGSKFLHNVIELTKITNNFTPEEGYYNDITDRFTKKFIDRFLSFKTPPEPDAFDTIANNYINTLNLLASKSGANSISAIEGLNELKSKIKNIISPVGAATRDSVIYFKGKLDQLTSQVLKLTNTKKVSNRRSGFDSFKDPATDLKNAHERDINIDHKFEYLFDANALKNTGYEFLLTSAAPANASGNPALPNKGLLRLSSNTYNTRVVNETLKYFKEENGSLNHSLAPAGGPGPTYNFGNISDQDTRHLSPSFVRLQDENWVMTSTPQGVLNPETPNLAQPVILDILSLNESRFKKERNLNVSKQNKDSKKEIRKQVMLQDILTKYGVTFVTGEGELDLDVTDALLYEEYEKLTTAYDDKEDDLEQFQNNIKDLTNIINENVNHASSFMMAFISNNVFSKLPLQQQGLRYFDLKNSVHNLIEKIKSKDKGLPFLPSNVSVYMQELPNQIKALFVSSLDAPHNTAARFKFYNFEDSIYGGDDIGKFYLHFQKLVEVQFLEGYKPIKVGSSTPSLRAPVWLPLLPANIPGTGTILCRLQPYRDRNIINSEVEELELPIYNQYFLIGSP